MSALSSSEIGSLPGGRAALLIGHPGHELRVHHWLEVARPIVCVITDGSGHGTTGRLLSTERVVHAAGAMPGPVFGRLSDRQVYEMLVRVDVGAWLALAEELAHCLRDSAIDNVMSDAAEGFNPTHDLCRYVSDAAIARAARQSGRAISTFEFDLEAAPDAHTEAVGASSIRLELDDEALARKTEAALGYVEMRGEVEAMLARFGRQAFAAETFRPAQSGATRWEGGPAPAYERHGRSRIADGIYRTLITYEAHLRPVQTALRDWSLQ